MAQILTQPEALKVAMKRMAPGSKFVKGVEHGDLFIFQINGPDPVEGDLDPFYSVNKKTGAFSDYYLADGGRELVLQFALS